MTKIRGFLDRVFRRRVRDASQVDTPTRVKLECTVATPDIAASPVSGTRAAMVRWTLVTARPVRSEQDRGTETHYDVLAMGCFGVEAFLLEAQGLSIEVPLSRSRFSLIEDPDDGQLLDHVPPELLDVVARLESTGPIAYREAYLCHGDVVELSATIERVPHSAGYRDTAKRTSDLRALPDERILIRDLSATR